MEKIPACSFSKKLSYNIHVTNPEMTIVHMASHLSYCELALLIHEFCGTYSISNNPEIGFINDIPPLTSISKLKSFIKQYSSTTSNIRNIRNLKDILNFASNDSASPMESRLFIKLSGPRSKGLYGCKNLKLNKKIQLTNSASRISGQRTIKPDISNIKEKVAIEYDSSQFHENSEQGQKDKRRRDALVKDG